VTDSTKPRRADARRNRDAVLAAAVRVLAERPEASMREIAEASGFGRTTLYRHFPHRDDLVRALYGRVFETAHAIVEAAVESGRAAWAAGDPADPDADALEVLVRTTLDLTDLGEQYRFLGAHRETGQQELEAMAAERGVEPLASYVADGQARGQLRDDLTVTWITDVIHGLTMMGAQHVRNGASSAPELRAMLARTVRGAIGPPAG
jgi:AcrR family transcriptional regulator